MKSIDYSQIILDIDGKPLCFPNGNPMALGQVLITVCARSADDDNLLSPEKVQNIGRIALKAHRGEDLRLAEVELMEARICAVFPPLLALLAVATLKGENLGIVPAVPAIPPPPVTAPYDSADQSDGPAEAAAPVVAAPTSTDTTTQDADATAADAQDAAADTTAAPANSDTTAPALDATVDASSTTAASTTPAPAADAATDSN